MDDPRSAASVRKAFYREECRQFLAGYSYQRPIFPRDPDHSSDEVLELTESICKINKTLALVAIDSLHYFYFAESLGIDVGNAQDKTVVVILDPAVRDYSTPSYFSSLLPRFFANRLNFLFPGRKSIRDARRIREKRTRAVHQ